MDEISIYKNLHDIDSLKSEESVKKVISHICNDLLKYIKSDGISVYIYNMSEGTIVPFIELKDAKKYSQKYTNIKIEKDMLELINLRGMELFPIERIETFFNSTKGELYKLEKVCDKSYFWTFKLAIGDDFLGTFNIMYKSDNVCKNEYYDVIIHVCKLISIIISGWILNKNLILENKKRIIVENELDEYLDKSIDLVSKYAIGGKLLSLSSSWTKVLGWSKDDLANRDIYEYAHLDDIGIIENLNIYLQNKNNKKARLKSRFLCKNGTYKWISWDIERSREGDAYFVTGKDITNEIIDKEEKEALEEKVRLEAMKSDLFTNLSHEFKTPLNIILGTMQVMEKYLKKGNKISKDDFERYLKNIKQNSYRVLKIVNNVTDISKMDIGYYEIHLSKNNIVNIIEDICLSVVEYAKNKDIEIIFDTDCEEIEMVCDPDAIERVILNLLSNAIKYSDNINGKIIVEVRNNEDFLFVSVKDNGRGIPKDKLKVIFDRFGQANGDLKEKTEGSGIGLYLVQSIIILHGGDIKVDSKENEGSNFTFYLPKNLIPDHEPINTSSIFEKPKFNIEKCKIEFSDIYN